jgi:hypothetical protein
MTTHKLVGKRIGAMAPLAFAIAVLVASLALPNVLAAEAAQVEDWRITSAGSSGTDVTVGPRFRLHNRTIGRALVYGERRFGINLVWGDSSGIPNVRFSRSSGTGPLRYNQLVGIHVAGGDYLRYKERPFGINLGWRSTPGNQWRIGGGEGVVKTGEAISLYNNVEKDVMVYASRPFGINLRWFKDVSDDQVTTANANLAVRIGPFPSPGECSGRVVWRLTPLSLTGSAGISHAVTVDRSFNENTVSVGPSEFYCQFDAVTGNLRTGTWRVQASTPVWNATCEASLHAGNNPVHFRQFRSSCVDGVGFP